MHYTTIAKVREHSGFLDTTKVTNERITRYIARATNLVNSYLSRVYVLPLPVFWEETIVFTGTGTGTGTFTMTWGAHSVSFTVTNGMTAVQAANLFRTAILNSTTLPFTTNDQNDSTSPTVTIRAISQDNESTDVTPDAVVIQSGITGTPGTATPNQDGYVEYLVTECTTAMLFIAEYGAEAQDTDKDGFKRMALLKEDLKLLATKEELLLDGEGLPFPFSRQSRLQFFPRDGSLDENDEPYERKTTWNKKY